MLLPLLLRPQQILQPSALMVLLPVSGGAGGSVAIESGGGLITLNDTTVNTFEAGGAGGGQQGSGGDIGFLGGNVQLATNTVTLNTGATEGSISFGTGAAPVAVSSANDENLILLAGSGAISFEGTVGAGANPLGSVLCQCWRF